MLAVVITAGLLLLLVAGAWQLTTARLEGVEVKRTQLVSEKATVFTGKDLENPKQIFEDREKLRNAVTVGLEALVVVVALAMVGAVWVTRGIPVYFKVAAMLTLGVGAALVARAMYVRLGLYHPALETLADYHETLSAAVDDAVAEDFTSIHGSLASARGDEVDEVAVGVLAAAKNGGQLDDVARWGEDVGIAEAEEFEARARTLAEADLVEFDGDHLQVGEPLQNADEDQIATVAASVLN